MADLNEREAAQGLRTIIEMEPRTKRTAWWRMVTIESNGARHHLTTWNEDSPARIRKRAKLEGVPIVEIPATN